MARFMLSAEKMERKSTLIKILSGIYPKGSFEGELIVEGRQRQFANVRESEDAGIATIYQEIDSIQELSIAENIFLEGSRTDSP